MNDLDDFPLIINSPSLGASNPPIISNNVDLPLLLSPTINIKPVLLNFILIKSYEKENNVLIPIIIHVCLNSITVLLINFIIKINVFLTTILFFVFLIVLIILLKILYKENNNGYDNNVNEC